MALVGYFCSRTLTSPPCPGFCQCTMDIAAPVIVIVAVVYVGQRRRCVPSVFLLPFFLRYQKWSSCQCYLRFGVFILPRFPLSAFLSITPPGRDMPQQTPRFLPLVFLV